MNAIVDFHAHPYLNEEQNLCMYEGVTPPDAISMRDQLTENGIGMICGCVLRRDRAFSFGELNDSALRLRELLGDFYVPGFHIHPAHVARSVAEIERMREQGVHLIGELVPYMHGWGDFGHTPYVRELNEILCAADPYPMTVSFHTTWEWPIDEVIAAHPGLTFVAAHPGERESVEKHIARMRAHENVYLDLSGTGIFRFGSIRRLVNAVGAERILFGTDYPICNPEMYIHAVLGERLSSGEQEKIFGQNAKRILKITAAQGL